MIGALAPQSDVDHTLRNELRGLRADVYTFLSMHGYALHAREGVKASENIEDKCEDFHQPQEHEAQPPSRLLSVPWCSSYPQCCSHHQLHDPLDHSNGN